MRTSHTGPAPQCVARHSALPATMHSHNDDNAHALACLTCRHEAHAASFGHGPDFSSDCWAAAEDAAASEAPLADVAGRHCAVSGASFAWYLEYQKTRHRPHQASLSRSSAESCERRLFRHALLR